jgi:hypothetical protein
MVNCTTVKKIGEILFKLLETRNRTAEKLYEYGMKGFK